MSFDRELAAAHEDRLRRGFTYGVVPVVDADEDGGYGRTHYLYLSWRCPLSGVIAFGGDDKGLAEFASALAAVALRDDGP